MRIVLVSQQVGHYTGGRYYAYQVACNLSLMGHDVTMLVDHRFDHIIRDYDWVEPKPKVVIHNFMMGMASIKDAVGRADLVIGVPILGVNVAAGLAQSSNCPLWVFIYDPPPLLAKYRGEEGTREVKVAYWNDLKAVIRKSKATVVTLGEFNVKPTQNWLENNVDVTWLYPVVNEPKINFALAKRNPWAIWISRIVPHKRFPHAIDAVKPYNLHLSVFCSRAHNGIVKARNMSERVTFYVNQSDNLKFEVLVQSSVLVHPAGYEGFGMPIVEAMMCGVPVVCYRYPMFEEIVKDSPAAVFMANDRDEFNMMVGQAYNEAVVGERIQDKRFSMESQQMRLKELLERYGK